MRAMMTKCGRVAYMLIKWLASYDNFVNRPTVLKFIGSRVSSRYWLALIPNSTLNSALDMQLHGTGRGGDAPTHRKTLITTL